MSQNDRAQGLIGHTGIKTPVRAATTANITLSGLQTIDGVVLAADDRVLVKNQTTGSGNGIYLADTGAWTRAKDFDGSYDIVQGTLVLIVSGTTQGGVVMKVTTANPITIGTTSLAFSAVTQLPDPVAAYIATLLDDTTAAIARNTLGLTNQRLWCGTATGTANALILTPAVAAEALIAGLEVVFVSSASANTAATTITVSGLAATAAQSNGVAMVGGEIEASKAYRATYDGAAFQVERIAPAILLELLTTKGDFAAATADGKAVPVALGGAGSVLMVRTAEATGLAYVAPMKAAIYGWTYANNAADAVNDIDIPAGGGMDATGAYWITGAASTKQSDVAWAVGNAAGALDTGAVGNSDYYIWAIARSDTGVVDYLFSLSSSAPTMPAGYDFKRLIGWFKRVGGTIVAFHTYETAGGGLEMNWDSPTLDVNLAATLTSARRTDAIKVPLNFSVVANINVEMDDAGANQQTIIYCPDMADLTPAAAAAPLCTTQTITTLGTQINMRVRTSSTGTIAARSSLATVDNYRVATVGFEWSRR